MHFKGLVLASFAVSIASAIPIPQACPFNWKRSAQAGGCTPQTAPLPSLLPYLSEPDAVPSITSPQYFSPDTNWANTPNTPAENAPAAITRPPPNPLSDYAPLSVPAVGGAAYGAWKFLQNIGGEGLGRGN